MILSENDFSTSPKYRGPVQKCCSNFNVFSNAKTLREGLNGKKNVFFRALPESLKLKLKTLRTRFGQDFEVEV